MFSKDDLAVIVTCFTEKNGLVLGLLDYSVWDILQELVYEGRRVNRLQTSKIFRMLSETNGMMSTIRQSEKLYCSGKGV